MIAEGFNETPHEYNGDLDGTSGVDYRYADPDASDTPHYQYSKPHLGCGETVSSNVHHEYIPGDTKDQYIDEGDITVENPTDTGDKIEGPGHDMPSNSIRHESDRLTPANNASEPDEPKRSTGSGGGTTPPHDTRPVPGASDGDGDVPDHKPDQPAEETAGTEANYMPHLEEITGAYQEVRDHNERNTGPGRLFCTTIEVMIEQEEAEAEGRTPVAMDAALDVAKTSTDMQGELLDVLHGDTFSRIGIKVMPLGQHVNAIEGKQVTSGKLLPIIDNTELFTSFLSSLSPGEVQHPAILTLTTDVVNTLQEVVVSAMTNPTGNQHENEVSQAYAEHSLRTFLAIDDQYKCLGIDNPESYQQILDAGKPKYLNEEWKRYSDAQRYVTNYKALESYVTYWGKDVLPEYIKIGPLKSLEQPNKAAFYFDGMQDQLAQDVGEIVTLIGPERTTEFGQEAAGAMLRGLEAILASMDTPEGEWYASDENRKLLRENIARLRQVSGSF